VSRRAAQHTLICLSLFVDSKNKWIKQFTEYLRIDGSNMRQQFSTIGIALSPAGKQEKAFLDYGLAHPGN